MRNKKIIKIGLLLIYLVMRGRFAAAQQNKALEGMPPDAPIQKFYMTAQKFNFKPEEIRIKQNTHVILEIESLDTTHGFKLKQFGIDAGIPARKKVKVEFYAREPGIYPFSCSRFCGLLHFWMDGKIIVEP